MKQKKKWPVYIEEALEDLDTLWATDKLMKRSEVVANYLKKHPDPLLKAKYDMAIMTCYMTSGQREVMYSVMSELSQSKLLSLDNTLKGQYHFYSSLIAYFKKDGNEPLHQAEKAVDTFRENGNKKWLAHSLLQVYNTISTFDLPHRYEPIDLLWEVISICDELRLADEVVVHLYSVACPGIAFLYSQEEKYAEALAFLQEPYRKLTELKSPSAFNLRMLMGSTLYSQGEYREALTIFEELYDPNYHKLNTAPHLFVCYYLLRSAMALGSLDQYTEPYHHYVDLAAQIQQPHELLKSKYIVALKQSLEGDRAAALGTMQTAKQIIDEQHLGEHAMEMYHYTQWNVYEHLGDYKEGWEAYRMNEKCRIRSKASLTDKKIEVLKNKVEMANRIKENALLKSDLERNARELELAATYLEKKNALIDEVLTFTNVLSKKHKHQNGLFEIKKKLISIKAEDTDRDKIKELLDKNNQEYIKKITREYSAITGTEAKICALIKAGLGNKEIASLLVTSPRTVDTHRSNIRRKMGLGKSDNLERMLRNI